MWWYWVSGCGRVVLSDMRSVPYVWAGTGLELPGSQDVPWHVRAMVHCGELPVTSSFLEGSLRCFAEALRCLGIPAWCFWVLLVYAGPGPTVLTQHGCLQKGSTLLGAWPTEGTNIPVFLRAAVGSGLRVCKVTTKRAREWSPSEILDAD